MENSKVNSQNKKIYEFIGKITDKHIKRVYNKRSNYYGNTYYRLQVELENQKKVKKILVFPKSKVWPNIEETNYHDKRYLFFCSPKVANYQIVSYQLVDWKELEKPLRKENNDHGSH